ncbi:MAG: hypothetical protein HXY30_17660 [Pseudorhodoplanes sp.]|nr:hypothetical protein [Pseudorhodoplanes sp.]
MRQEQQSLAAGGGRIISYDEAVARRERRRAAASQATDDLKKFQHSGEADDYRHRMTMNVAGLAVVTVLIVAAIWIADSLAEMRKSHDCALGGRACAKVAVPPIQRW